MPIFVKGGGGGGVTPSGTRDITANGTYDVTNYASAKVAVPEPSGTKSITTNGTHDVKNYASVDVNVASSGASSKEVALWFDGTDAFMSGSTVIRINWADALSAAGISASYKIAKIKYLSVVCRGRFTGLSGGATAFYTTSAYYDVTKETGWAYSSADLAVTGGNVDPLAASISSVSYDDSRVLVYLSSGVYPVNLEAAADSSGGIIVVELY